MKTRFKLIYKNFFGEFNILITETTDGKYPTKYTLIPDIEIYNAHIWINDNVVQKNHTGKEIFLLNSFVDSDELRNVLGNVL